MIDQLQTEKQRTWCQKIIASAFGHENPVPFDMILEETKSKDKPHHYFLFTSVTEYRHILSVGKGWLKVNLTPEEFAEYIVDKMTGNLVIKATL